MIHALVAAAALSFSTPTDYITAWLRPPALNLSAIRLIKCDHWTGTGFLIGPRIMATANHVMDGTERCIDVQSGVVIRAYKTDPKHDLALVTGNLPTNMPYINYSCDRFKTGQKYLSYGITSYMQERNILRNNVLTATRNYNANGTVWKDEIDVSGSRIFSGYQAPGMSGGPVLDIDGYAHGLVTGGSAYDSSHFEFADGILCNP
jgi:hypothetical protein